MASTESVLYKLSQNNTCFVKGTLCWEEGKGVWGKRPQVWSVCMIFIVHEAWFVLLQWEENRSVDIIKLTTVLPSDKNTLFTIHLGAKSTFSSFSMI